MRPTRVRVAGRPAASASAAVTWGVLQIMLDRGEVLPPLTWTAPSFIALLAIVVLATALGLRARLDDPEKRPHPLSMARMAVLGKASAHVGPIVGGLYAGYLLVLLPGLEIASRRDRVGALPGGAAGLDRPLGGRAAAGAGLPGAAVRHRRRDPRGPRLTRRTGRSIGSGGGDRLHLDRLGVDAR